MPELSTTLESGRPVIITWDTATARYVEGLSIYRALPDGSRGPDITDRVVDPSPDYDTVMRAITEYYETWLD